MTAPAVGFALAVAGAVLAGCATPVARPVATSAGRSAAGPTSAGPTSEGPGSNGSSAAPTVLATLAGVPLELEVADDPEERAVGLMGRRGVPVGTGMLFRYDEPSTNRFYMFRVPIPLRATFLRDGQVVSSVVMPPCAELDGADCPTYGPDEPYDAVVETAPEMLPDVAAGDAFVLDGPSSSVRKPSG